MVSRYALLKKALTNLLPIEQIITDTALCLALGTDASFYRMLPKIVLRLKNTQEVIDVVTLCNQHHIHCTFRAAGTSLSGQAISDSVLITLTDDWRGYEIGDQGNTITLQPGVIGADANKYLAPFGRKIGPDPASINSCKVGGIAANNASGMCCGTAQNSYRTLAGLSLVLADGTYLDTRDELSKAAFAKQQPQLLAGLEQLHNTVLNNPALSERIHHKYRLKNTTGYSLNALLDFTDPFDMLAHLMIGSEGTLGFINDITYHTVSDPAFKASCLLVYPDIETTCLAVTELANTQVAAVELMDGRALRSIADNPGMPDFIKQLDLEAAALLIEVRSETEAQLLQSCAHAMTTIERFSRLNQVAFTQDKTLCANLWAMRKGMFPAVGAVRETGTTVVIEDVAFHVEHLAAAVRKLNQLFEQFGYTEAIIFGHALAGNLHFVFTQGFDSESERQRYGDFMAAVTQLVAVEYQGSLKAEHGTGRNMAPFVELEWGKDGYQLVQQIKALFDPQGILNPGVIVNADSKAHLQHLKPLPPAEPLVDKCIECGFCEAVCPSRNLSLTPRQRIVLYRELQRRQANHEIIDDNLQQIFEYQGVDTCAATGLCEQRCPVGINTGDLVRKLRTARYQKFQPIARWTAAHFTGTTQAVAIGLNTANSISKVVGNQAMARFNSSLRYVSRNKLPMWFPELPAANSAQSSVATQLSQQPKKLSTAKKVVYFPSCASRTLAQSKQATDSRSLTEVTLSVLAKAGFEVIIPSQLHSLCCGMPYQSKGLFDVADNKVQELEQALWQASEQGHWPILMDTSPCAKQSVDSFNKSRVEQKEGSQKLTVYEPITFVLEYALEHLPLTPINETVMLHITCSSQRMGLADKMLALAKRCATEVIVPEHISCCGFAGDKGFTLPELNASALATLKQQIPKGCTRGISNSRTCELGLSHHSGINYESILYLVDEAAAAP
ncbi:FAD-binding and (Fe-S)-binding domain-containing protein [Oceanisphaera pacifica]|uniref:D-lactate dehydrogenase (cytochrome) n=1 Tax=Oceanisphaera pacifica TaxID=2818389 RepID=A0ABS3NI81_9GAMM|nr:FAD-binding and (Fe-S)-binding domain-containing protein [Oceanisphaera pacifica]MBO1520288.1 FAD-binding oxidoreductase [Oceanisphaera pacifica]